MKSKWAPIMLLSNFITVLLPALSGELNILQVIRLSLMAASPAIYGEASLYTGIPRISITLYRSQNKEINALTSQNYYRDDMQINQEGSKVGLGWSWTYGGVITTIVHRLSMYWVIIYKDSIHSNGYHWQQN